VDDQGLEAGYHSKNEAKTSKKHTKRARFESCAPIMPQNAPKKNPEYVSVVYGFYLDTSVLILLKKEPLKYKQSIDKIKNMC